MQRRVTAEQRLFWQKARQHLLEVDRRLASCRVSAEEGADSRVVMVQARAAESAALRLHRTIEQRPVSLR
jgi:hypothetical protein